MVGTVGAMRIATWNVNSVRVRAARLEVWLDRQQPDVVLLQETKCSDDTFPSDLFAVRGYEVAHWGGGPYNGVAIASRVGLDRIRRGLDVDSARRLELEHLAHGWPEAWRDEPRLLTAQAGPLVVCSVYVPNGRELEHPHYQYKLAWLDALATHLAGLGGPVVVGGDFNVAPEDRDVWSPKAWRGRTHVSEPERDRIRALAEQGWVDLWHREHRSPADTQISTPPARGRTGLPAGLDRVRAGFTWFNYRTRGFEKNQGLRIDLLLANPTAAGDGTSCWVDLDERAAEKPSDHAPLLCDIPLTGAMAARRAGAATAA